jgi:23S rRNA pseudouridine2605 synthase
MAQRPPPRGQRRGPKPGGSRSGGPPRKPAGHRHDAPGRTTAPRPELRTGTPPRGEASHEPERLQKILAHAGVGSRRACEELILQGRITVNGQVARELGTRVDPQAATIAVDGEAIRLERHVYYAVHKPKGYVSTNNDPAGRPRVVDLLPEVPERVYAVGRLDEQSTGLMLLTNDGELANKLAHPRFGVEKVYRVVVAGEPGRELFDKMIEGVWLAEGKVRAKRVRPVARRGQATVLEMTLAEGKNREIRRMLARFGHKVMSLTRIAVGPVALKGLGVGEARPLSGREIELLRQVAAGLYVPAPKFPDKRPRIPRGGAAPASGRGSAHATEARPSERRPPRPPQASQGGRPRIPTPPHAEESRPPRSPAPRPTGQRASAGPPRRPQPTRPGGPPPRPQSPATPPPATPPPPGPVRRSKPPQDAERADPPQRIILGLTPEPPPRSSEARPPGPRLHRPAPRRSPRSALGLNRKKRPETEGGES